MAKLLNYCLNPNHLRGRHKARVFLSALGIGRSEAAVLRDALSKAARERDATPAGTDSFGYRYTIDFELEHAERCATIRSQWIIRRVELSPRLVTCFVRLKGGDHAKI